MRYYLDNVKLHNDLMIAPVEPRPERGRRIAAADKIAQFQTISLRRIETKRRIPYYCCLRNAASWAGLDTPPFIAASSTAFILPGGYSTDAHSIGRKRDIVQVVTSNETMEDNFVTEPTAKAIHYTDVEAQIFGEEAPGVTIRWVIDEEHDGAPVYALRVIEVAAGGHTPQHTHPYEHENFVLEGQGRVLLGETWRDIGPGSVVFVPPDLLHTYVNAGPTPFRFLCGIPTSRLIPKA